MRLIDKDVLIETIHKNPATNHSMRCVQLLDGILNAPPVNAVPVIRCKSCRYSEPMPKYGVYRFGENALNCTQCRGDNGYGYAGISVIHPDDYCSDGALRDEEGD